MDVFSFLLALVAGTASTLDNGPRQVRPVTLMLIGGSDPALKGFELAAHRCGLAGVSRIKAEAGTGTWVRVSGTTEQIGTDSHLTCATKYLFSHMNGPDALSIIGNGQRGR